jgi:hypothetical protein
LQQRLVNGSDFGPVAMPTLWRGAAQMIRGAGHAPQWETSEAFDALIEAFVYETARGRMRFLTAPRAA